MATAILMKHPAGPVTTAFNGFSWTAFFFGFFVPLFRADWKWATISVVVSVLGSLLLFIPNIIWWFVFAVKYNEWHKNDLLLSGFKEE